MHFFIKPNSKSIDDDISHCKKFSCVQFCSAFLQDIRLY